MKHKSQQGMTILVVLIFMILATLVSTVIYKVTLQSDRESLSEKQLKQIQVAVESGKRATQSFMTYHSMDFMGMVNQFYQDNIVNPDASGKLKPVKFPLPSMVRSGDNINEGFTAYLAGINMNPNQPDVDLQVKVQVHAFQMRDTVQVGEMVQNYVFDVSGIEMDSTVITTLPESTCGPDMAFWAGSGVSTGNININLQVTSGGAYFGTNYTLNGGSGMQYAGDLIIGGNPGTTTPGSVNGGINISGNLYITQPLDLNGSTTHNVGGHAVLKGGWAGGDITSNLVVNGDLYIEGGTANNFNVTNSNYIQVGGNYEADQSNRGTGPVRVAGSAILRNGQVGGGVMDVTGNTVILGDYNHSTWTQSFFRDSLQVFGDYTSNTRTVISNGLWADNHTTSNPTSIDFASSIDTLGVVSANKLEYVESYMNSSFEIPISFGFDADTIDTHKVTWNTLRQKMYDLGDSDYQSYCPQLSFGNFLDAPRCKYFSGRAAQLMWANEDLKSAFAHNGFIFLDLDGVIGHTTGTKFFYSGDSGGNPVLGNWVLTKTNGLMEMDASQDLTFPAVDPTGRILFWLRNTASLKTFRVGGSGEFYGVFMHEGQDYDNSNDVGNTQIIGGMYLNNTGATRLNGGGGTLTLSLDKDVFSDIGSAAMTKKDSNGNVTGFCAESTGGSTSYNQGMAMTSQQLNVRMRASYRAGSDALNVNGTDTTYTSPEDELPFLALSRYSVSVNPSEYPTFSSILDTFDIEPIASYKGQIYTASTISGVCDGGAWSGDSYVSTADSLFTKTFTLTCAGGTLSKKLFIDQSSTKDVEGDVSGTSSVNPTGTSSATSSTVVISSSSDALSSSSTGIDVTPRGYICDTLPLDLHSVQLHTAASYDETPYPYQIGRNSRPSNVSNAETLMKLDMTNITGTIINAYFTVDYTSSTGRWNGKTYEAFVTSQTAITPSWTTANGYTDLGLTDWESETKLASHTLDSTELGEIKMTSVGSELNDWLTARSGFTQNEGWVLSMNTNTNGRGKRLSGANIYLCASGGINGKTVNPADTISEFTIDFETIPANKATFNPSGVTADSGDIASVTATLTSGYTNDGWLDDRTNTLNSRSFTLESDSTYKIVLNVPQGDCSSSGAYNPSHVDYYSGETVTYSNKLYKCRSYGECDGHLPTDGSKWDDLGTTCVSLPACHTAYTAKAYGGGSEVSLSGKNYKACFYAESYQTPGNTSHTTSGSCSGKPWVEEGDCQ